MKVTITSAGHTVEIDTDEQITTDQLTQLATAVWVGNPKGYVPMVNIPEFVKVGVRSVQGATFPARIWKQFMDVAHEGLPILKFPAPPAEGREAMLLYLPGTDCLVQSVGLDGKPLPTSTSLPAGATGPVSTVVQAIDPATTVPADVIDPLWPLPMAPIDAVLVPCPTDGSGTTTSTAVPPSTTLIVDETVPPGTDPPDTTADPGPSTTASAGPPRQRRIAG